MGEARDLVKWWACMELGQGAAAEAANFRGLRRGEEAIQKTQGYEGLAEGLVCGHSADRGEML